MKAPLKKSLSNDRINLYADIKLKLRELIKKSLFGRKEFRTDLKPLGLLLGVFYVDYLL